MFILSTNGLTAEKVVNNYNRGRYSLADVYQYLQAMLANGDISANEALKAYSEVCQTANGRPQL